MTDGAPENVKTDAPEISLVQRRGGDNHSADRSEYTWTSAGHAHNHSVLLPSLRSILGAGDGRDLIDLGCGNGSLTAALASDGFTTVGLDVAGSGIREAQSEHPSLTFQEHDLEQALPQALRGQFDIALSAEVIEHLYLPRALFRRADEALRPGGRLVVTTPYHGWLKNLALAVTNKFDSHWNPGWDYGHIKFFSVPSLTALAADCGYRVSSVHRVGRIPPLAMSMIVVASKET